MKFTKTLGKPKMLSISFSNFYVTVAPYFWSNLFVPLCLLLYNLIPNMAPASAGARLQYRGSTSGRSRYGELVIFI